MRSRIPSKLMRSIPPSKDELFERNLTPNSIYLKFKFKIKSNFTTMKMQVVATSQRISFDTDRGVSVVLLCGETGVLRGNPAVRPGKNPKPISYVKAGTLTQTSLVSGQSVNSLPSRTNAFSQSQV